MSAITYEEKVRWLRRYQDSLRLERALQQELEAQHSRACRMTTALTGMPKRNTENNTIQHSVERILELEELLKLQSESCTSTCYEVINFIDSISDSRIQELFRYRYLVGKSWEEVAERMELSSKWVKLLHDRYLRNSEIL